MGAACSRERPNAVITAPNRGYKPLPQGLYQAPGIVPADIPFRAGGGTRPGLDRGVIRNLYALWLFGVPLERRWGPQRFAVFFFACVIGAALLHLAVAEFAQGQGGVSHPALGSSGGVFGLLLAFGMLYPDVELILLFPPIPVKAKWFVVGYGAVELVAGVTGTVAGIAHFAHLGGMLTGFLLLRGSRWLR